MKKCVFYWTKFSAPSDQCVRHMLTHHLLCKILLSEFNRRVTEADHTHKLNYGYRPKTDHSLKLKFTHLFNPTKSDSWLRLAIICSILGMDGSKVDLWTNKLFHHTNFRTKLSSSQKRFKPTDEVFGLTRRGNSYCCKLITNSLQLQCMTDGSSKTWPMLTAENGAKFTSSKRCILNIRSERTVTAHLLGNSNAACSWIKSIALLKRKNRRILRTLTSSRIITTLKACI